MTAGNGQEALAAYNRPHQTIAAVITDYMMPDLNGIALIRALQEINPKVRVIASTGDLQESKMAELGTLNPSAILLKPYTRSNFLTTVHHVLHDVRASY